MLFLIRTEFRRPPEIDDLEYLLLMGNEARRAKALQEEGTILHLWREPGAFVSWGLWQAETQPAVRARLRSLPCHYAMTVAVREIVDHPNSIRPSDGGGSQP